MRILISNDDGYKARGIKVLIKELKNIAQITVVAPSRNRSGASSSLSLDKPIKVTKKEDSFYFLSGTPTDCDHIALTGLMQTLPDMVISGINHGPNLGDDTIYSGTVAAAIEGYLLNIPSFAISMGSMNPKNFITAAKVTTNLIKLYNEFEHKSASLLNINVPDIPYNELKGFEVTRLGKRHAAKKAKEKRHNKKESLYWIGEVGEPNDGGSGTDFDALKNNFVSISPIHPDLTDFKNIELTKNWIK